MSTNTTAETPSTFTCGHCGAAEDGIDALIEHVFECDENDHARSR